ncbi:MAG: hypothetical protein J6N52_08560 [Clostridia bacterium]|nr:hypothetical protein [Clostridia bacterium]
MKLLGKTCTAAMLFIILSAAACRAEEPVNVVLKDYMPPARTVYVDDNFNNQQGEVPEGGTDITGVQAYASSDITVAADGDNKYLKLSNFGGYIYPVGQNTIDSDRLTVSFDVKNGYGDNGNFNAPVVLIGRMKSAYSAAEFARFNTWNASIQGQFDLNNSTDKTSGFTVPKDEWFNVTVTFERKLKEDGSGYEVFVTKCIINGKIIGLNTLTTASSSAADWWSPNEGMNTLSIRASRGSNAGGYTCIDNLLIYEPLNFEVASCGFRDGVLMAELTGKCMADADIMLVGENGTYQCTTELADGGKSIIIIPPVDIDLENRSYYVVINKLTSISGETVSDYKILLEKEYLRESEVSAYVSDGKIVASAYVEPVSGGSVYMIAAAWKGEKCVDMKITECSLASAGQCTVETEQGISADRVQIFFIDSTENMRLVSEVHNIELEV